ncbi:NADPH2:quinone reductase [Streptoalloteichus tenebrarius]|uniref:NADPH2:quinone reductase n=1 Tax=Streptoalloteichus tenebrarius (strain ATCC 17920 / DSM 40477 / JCM 4838 / CBS 697.72 / NBRC 16177 / NCIMB 11028 / NRRL B-12390 / A12253. 1 / ISP 5477) TaxID=1933 RepID=A0ABT1HPJ0_STRSD|nr:zinc-binding dehydrogenase [Streptoalloteichus tenebrarius]MCP2257433.1 NADPH2:quinone reductase [Streptoalloteichus tenebrarius]BFE98378.1 zinc-binding dehydrogenase [Streptoalloteichus tenebrarius]
MRAVQFSTFGGPEVLREVLLPDPVPGRDEHLVDVEASGVNFADLRQVAGEYARPDRLPHVPGMEVVGRTGDGQRVLGYTTRGGYASKVVVAARDLVAVPEGVGAAEALAVLVQGLSAWHMLRSLARITRGESVVVHAAAGGVGSLAVQLARHFGAGRVIATASTAEKRDLALTLGADVAVDGQAEGYTERVLAANGGRGVDIVLDAQGGKVLHAALDALAPFGRLISYGSSSGDTPPPIDSYRLVERNVSMAGFWLAPLLARSGAAGAPLRELLDLVAAGRLRPLVGGEYDLADAAKAHEDLASRRTVGKLVLRPGQ